MLDVKMKKVVVRLEDVSKTFGDNRKIIDNLFLDVYEKEFLTLFGPSGCDKTTILSMISRLESVSAGKIYIGDDDVTNVNVSDREVEPIYARKILLGGGNIHCIMQQVPKENRK